MQGGTRKGSVKFGTGSEPCGKGSGALCQAAAPKRIYAGNAMSGQSSSEPVPHGSNPSRQKQMRAAGPKACRKREGHSPAMPQVYAAGPAPMSDHPLHHASPVSLRCTPVSRIKELRQASAARRFGGRRLLLL